MTLMACNGIKKLHKINTANTKFFTLCLFTWPRARTRFSSSFSQISIGACLTRARQKKTQNMLRSFLFIIVNTNMCNIITANQRIGTHSIHIANEMNGTLFVSMRSGPFFIHSLCIYINIHWIFILPPAKESVCVCVNAQESEQRTNGREKKYRHHWYVKTLKNVCEWAHTGTPLKSKPFAAFLYHTVATTSTPAHFFNTSSIYLVCVFFVCSVAVVGAATSLFFSVCASLVRVISFASHFYTWHNVDWFMHFILGCYFIFFCSLCCIR